MMSDQPPVAVLVPDEPAGDALPLVSGRCWLQWTLMLPLALFIGFAALSYPMLWRDPHLVASVLIGKPVPTFRLPPVRGRSLGLSSGDLRSHVSLVNVFASWCVACRAEHPLLMQLSRQKAVRLFGIDYVAIDGGVYEVPETFVVSADGRIAFKQIGPITPEILDETILPLVARLRRSAIGAGR